MNGQRHTGNLLSDESGESLKVRVYERLLNDVNSLAREGPICVRTARMALNLITNYTFDAPRAFMVEHRRRGALADKVGIDCDHRC
ncbi:MAG: hypothetical protein LC114_19745 [Bryobacterales bacterium]|nr:hypothetical protein [Bryobacterales bacterium]